MHRIFLSIVLLFLAALAWRVGAAAMWMMYAAFRLVLGLFVLSIVGVAVWVAYKCIAWETRRFGREL